MFFYSESDSVSGDNQLDEWVLQLRQTWETGDTDHTASGEIVKRFTDGTSNWVAGHSSLSNSISFAGEKCLNISSSHRPYQHQRLYANTTELVSTSQSTAVSIRVLIRDINSYGHVALMFRGRNDGNYDGGYVFGNFNGKLHATGVGDIQNMAPSYVWKWYRADLIPQFVNGVWVNDKLEYYIAEATANPNWTLVGEAYQSSIPWNHGTYKYHQIYFHDWSSSGAYKVFWIDNLEFYTKEV